MASLGPSQTSKMELFVTTVKGMKLLTNIAKYSILDISMGSKYTFVFGKYWKVVDFVISLNTQL